MISFTEKLSPPIKEHEAQYMVFRFEEIDFHLHHFVPDKKTGHFKAVECTVDTEPRKWFLQGYIHGLMRSIKEMRTLQEEIENRKG